MLLYPAIWYLGRMDAPRTLAQRKADTLALLARAVDAWVATAAADTPHLVPLSFLWNGETLLLATPATTPTARNLLANGLVRLSLGTLRDVVQIAGTASVVADIGSPEADAFAAKTGFDPRRPHSLFLYFRVSPQRIQAWRNERELEGRVLMREGQWHEG